MQNESTCQTTEVLAPISESDRIYSIDVMRGVALLGILLMNIVMMALPDPAYYDPSGYGGDTGWNLGCWIINSVFFEGTMRGMFSLLFGAGILLFTGKGETKGAGLSIADAWYRRTIWLVIFGVIHAYILLWPGDILYMYGLMGMFLFPFRNTSAGRLFTLGIVLFLIGAGLNIHDNVKASKLSADAIEAARLIDANQEVPHALQNSQDEWAGKLEKMDPSIEAKEEAVTKMQNGYFSAMAQASHMSYWMESEFHYRYSYVDILNMMFLGMALFKWKVLQAALNSKWYIAMTIIGYGVGLSVNWYETATYMGSDFDLVLYYRTGITYDLGRLFTMVGHIGLIMLFCKSSRLPWLRKSLAAVGRMALTNYIMHTLIATTIFVGFAQYGKWQRYELYYLVFGIWLFQLVVSPIWLRRFHFGPLEWLWRRLTYLKKQPFLR